MRPIRSRSAVAAALALAVSAALSGCSLQSPVSARVLTIAAARTRYLDAMCPLFAQPTFWSATDGATLAEARASAADALPAGQRASSLLGSPPRPWPAQMASSIATLRHAIRVNTTRLGGIEAARDASALAAVPAPVAVPQQAVDGIESLVYVSAAAGSPNCVGHGVGAPSPSPTP